MKWIDPPKTAYDSIEDVGKFNMIWNVSLILVPVFLILLCIHVYFRDPSWTTSLAAMSVAVINLVVLSKTRKYKVIGATTVVLAVALCQIAIFIVGDSHLVTDTMWCIIAAFFTFFLFGVWLGAFVLLLNLSGLMLFLLISPDTYLLSKGILPENADGKMLINVYYVALALIFIIYKMMQNNKKINNELEQQISKNEILLKEIHHRVKNNLQIISSLIRLQASDSNDPLVKEQFGEAVGRIRSMALIHEKMYQEDDMSSIDLPSYLVSLVKDIIDTTQSDCNIEFDVNSELHDVNLKHIVPMSLIFNELITNSIKHGLRDRNDGRIQMKISHRDHQIDFHYSDNGIWKEPSPESSFGLELIETLVQQMEGTCKREVKEGTHYYLTFDERHFFQSGDNIA